MSTKVEIKETIESYLKVENEIKVLQKELKQRREKKKIYAESLVNIMKNNDIDCFDLSEGKIIYTQNKVKSALNKKHLQECLDRYFNNLPNIDTQDVTTFIFENRTETIKENIRHKPNK